MSIPGYDGITMRANRITCVKFNAFNNFSVCNKINNILSRNKIAIVIVETNRFYFLRNMFFDLLSNEEKYYGNNFKFEDLRDKYYIHRGILRILLSKLINKKSSSINIFVNPYGKPFVECSSNVRFNLSHSNNYALYAFTVGSEVGIDVEEDNYQININEIAPLVLSIDEYKYFRHLDSLQQRNIFFKLWTSKEALSKNYGFGMTMDFKQIHVGLNNSSFENLFYMIFQFLILIMLLWL